MICSKCGQENADGTKFCTNCGAEMTVEEQKNTAVESETAAEETAAVNAEEPVEEIKAEEEVTTEEEVTESVTEESEPEEEKPAERVTDNEKKNFDMKKLLKYVLPVAAVLIFIIIIANLCKGEKYITANKDTIVNVFNTGNGSAVLYNSGKMTDNDNELDSEVIYSTDHSVAAFTNSDDELIIIKGKKIVKTGIDEVNGIVVSAKGDTVSYYRDMDGGLGTLYLYYVKNGKVKEIAEDVRLNSAVLSPNGKTVAFVGDYEASDDFKGYYSIDGKNPVEFGKEKRIFAIADKAKYVYYTDEDRVYALKKGKEGEKLATDVSSHVNAYLNADNTEIMVYHDGKMYVSVNGKEKKKISNDRIYGVILPCDALTQTISCSGIGGASVSVTNTGVKTFKEQLASTEDGIGYITKKWEITSVMHASKQYELSDDGKTLSVLDYGNNIYNVTDFAKGGRKKQIASDTDAVSFYVDGDNKYFYFINEDDELYFSKGKKPKKIADDVTEACISADGKTCYFIVDDEKLYCSSKGGSKKAIKEADDEISCARAGQNVFVSLMDDDSIKMYLANGKKLKEIFKFEE